VGVGGLELELEALGAGVKSVREVEVMGFTAQEEGYAWKSFFICRPPVDESCGEDQVRVPGKLPR
jgi:hypothetical protein